MIPHSPLLALKSLLAAGVLLLGATNAGAQTIADVAKYSGPDRTQKLVDGAKKEAALTLYGSAAVDDINPILAAFQKKYGIKVTNWRASSENVLQRGVTEYRAGRYDADVFETNGPEMEALSREKVLQEIQSPALSDLIPQAIRPHKLWVGTRLNVFVSAYNTNAVKKADLPKTWEELADPKWKGKLGIEAEDTDWFATVVTSLGEEKGLKLFRDIAAKNGISVRKGHTLLTNLVASGEVPLSLTVYNYKVDQLKAGGAPIDWFSLPPTVARANGIGVSNKTKHPHAAVLFFDFMLTDAQKILAERDFVPTNTKVKQLPADLKLSFVDPALMLDQGAKWEKLYKEIITSQAGGIKF